MNNCLKEEEFTFLKEKKHQNLMVTILYVLCYPIEAGLISLLVCFATVNQATCKHLYLIELLVGDIHATNSVGAERHIGIQQQARCNLRDCTCRLW